MSGVKDACELTRAAGMEWWTRGGNHKWTWLPLWGAGLGLLGGGEDVKRQFPQFKAVESYRELIGLVKGATG